MLDRVSFPKNKGFGEILWRQTRYCLAGIITMVACSPTAQSCLSCPIALTPVVTLGDSGPPGSLSAAATSIARDSRGNYYVATPRSPEPLPSIYDSTGTFVGHLGRQGNGPGELLRGALVLVAPGDTILVFDQTRRLEVYDPQWRPVRSAVGTPMAYRGRILPSGEVLLDVSTPGGSIHILREDGEVTRSFGDFHGGDPRTTAPVHALALADDSSFWGVSGMREFVVERWHVRGRRLTRTTWSTGWFVPWTEWMAPTPETAPLAQVFDAFVDTRGRLWILGSTAAADWSDVLGPCHPTRTGHDSCDMPPDGRGVYAAVIEVLDPSTEVVLARRRFPDAARFHVVDPGLVASVRESPAGWWYVDVFNATLTDTADAP